MNTKQSPEKPAELTEAEWAVMRVVWDHQPCTAGTVQETLAQEKTWAYSTVKTTMDRMVKKGTLEVRKMRNLQLFSARVGQIEARKSELKRMLNRAFDGALGPMMQFLVEQESLSKEELQHLRNLIDNHEA